MAEKEDVGFIGSIRRLSRRLSGNILSADFKDVKAYLIRNDKRNAYTYDSEDQMRIGGILAKDLAEEYGTPLYIYDIKRIHENYNMFLGSLKNKNFLLCYAVKANPNLAILNIYSRLGAGFDVVSGGEISRCLAADVDPSKIVFSGCGKTLDEIELAVKSEISCINVESWDELDRIEIMAAKYNKVQSVSIRINPDLHLDGHSHPNILTGASNHKFGVPIAEALEIYSRVKASAHLKIKGMSCHLGSNIGQLEPFLEARDKLLHLADELRQESKICVEHINLGGGFPLVLANGEAPDIQSWIEKIAAPIIERGLKLILEPGRSLIADAGVLLTKIEYIKSTRREPTSGSMSPRSGSLVNTSPFEKGVHHHHHHHHHRPLNKTFAIVDAGFNDFLRTALYSQQHYIAPSVLKHSSGALQEYKYDVVGPICETTDYFFRDFGLNQKLEIGEYLAITDAGAYGSSMASNYNSRNKPAEVIITDRNPILIRERESYEEQYGKEKMIPDIKLTSLTTVEECESQEDLTKNEENEENVPPEQPEAKPQE